MVSYQFSTSCLIWGSTPFFQVVGNDSLVSVTGTLEYRPEMSSKAREECGRIGVLSSLLLSSLVLPMVNVLGGGAISLPFFVKSWASLYAGAPLQLTTGRIGCSGLCSLIKPQ